MGLLYNKKCIECGGVMTRHKKSEAARPNWRYCSGTCRRIFLNKKSVIVNPISGQTSCLFCRKDFPYSNTALKRSVVYKSVGRIAKVGQVFCSHRCASLYKNIFHNPMKLPENRGKISGENNYAWKGGVSDRNRHVIDSSAYKEWRKSVFSRDDYICQSCGDRGGDLVADHELPWAYFPTLRFEVLNGRTLCVPCHKKTDTYAGRVRTLAKSLNWV